MRPVLRSSGRERETSWGEALTAVKEAVDAARATDPASVLVLGSPFHATEESWLLAQLFRTALGLPHVEFDADLGARRRIPNPNAKGAVHRFLEGVEASPNSRGAEAAGVTRAEAGAAFTRLVDGSYTPTVLYVADAAFCERTSDPAFAAALRRAKVLIVNARTKNALSEAADVVLPVAPLTGKEGTFVNVQGYVQRFDLAIVPPPIVRSDLEVLLHLGRRWDVFDTTWTARAVFERMKAEVPGYAGLEWDALAGSPPVTAPASAYDVLLAHGAGEGRSA